MSIENAGHNHQRKMNIPFTFLKGKDRVLFEPNLGQLPGMPRNIWCGVINIFYIKSYKFLDKRAFQKVADLLLGF